jgi:predicted house-cleaning noncanonical NTP pyrophosphatase (MazG superfamily)
MSNPMKLVRDKFPPADDPNINLIYEDRHEELNKLYSLKVLEERLEILNSDCKDPKEFADLLEVVIGWAKENGISEKELLNAWEDKREKKGALSNRVLTTLNPNNPSNKPYFENHE